MACQSLFSENIVVLGDFNIPQYNLNIYSCPKCELAHIFMDVFQIRQFNEVPNVNQ